MVSIGKWGPRSDGGVEVVPYSHKKPLPTDFLRRFIGNSLALHMRTSSSWSFVSPPHTLPPITTGWTKTFIWEVCTHDGDVSQTGKDVIYAPGTTSVKGVLTYILFELIRSYLYQSPAKRTHEII